MHFDLWKASEVASQCNWFASTFGQCYLHQSLTLFF